MITAQRPATQIDWLTVFEERCDARAYLVAAGQMQIQEAVDGLQEAATRTGLIELLGQDGVQSIMARFFNEGADGR